MLHFFTCGHERSQKVLALAVGWRLRIFLLEEPMQIKIFVPTNEYLLEIIVYWGKNEIAGVFRVREDDLLSIMFSPLCMVDY